MVEVVPAVMAVQADVAVVPLQRVELLNVQLEAQPVIVQAMTHVIVRIPLYVL